MRVVVFGLLGGLITPLCSHNFLRYNVRSQIWIEHGGNEANATAGEVLFGGVDKEHCEDVIDYIPLIGDHHWSFAVTEFQVGDVKISGQW